MDPTRYDYDIFISYSHADSQWVNEWLLPQLEAGGLKVCIDHRDFQIGVPSIRNMEQAVERSRYTLIVLTPAWVDSQWGDFESLLAGTSDPNARNRRILPLMLEPCRPPSRLALLTYADFTHPQKHAPELQRLIAQIRDLADQSQILPPAEQPAQPAPQAIKEDWGEASDAGALYGREEELGTLAQWIIQDGCRLVGVFGLGGIGKTALAITFATQHRERFDYIFWRSLLNAPPLEDLLRECLLLVSDQRETNLPQGLDKQMRLLIGYLRQRRCLIVLDNAETILREGDRAGQYREGYEDYGDFVRRMGEAAHQSCLLLTSREKLKEFVPLEGATSLVRSLFVAGVAADGGREILKDKGLSGTDQAWRTLVDTYSGNPLALKIIAEVIREDFQSDIDRFLQEGIVLSNDVRLLVDRQFDQLSELEQVIMYWLAIEREPVSIEGLRTDMIRSVPKWELQDALSSLRRRSLIEPGASGFTLQNYILECVTDRLIDIVEQVTNRLIEHVSQDEILDSVTDRLVQRISKEIEDEDISLFRSHALIKAQAKDYIRESQIRFIMTPLIEVLLSKFDKQRIEQKLKAILSRLRDEKQRKPGYAGGNALNLLVQLKSDLRYSDFSYLTVWQAYLQGVELHDVNFSYADLSQSVFTETFSLVLAVAFSPDGALLASANADGSVQVRQVSDGKQLYTCKGHTDWVWHVAFSPDGGTLASSGDDQTIRLWSASAGQAQKTLQGHTDWVRALAFSPQDRLLASGSADRTIRLWDAQSGQCVAVLEGHTSQVWSVAFSPDGHTLASGGGDGAVRIWDVATRQARQTFRADTYRVFAVAFSPQGGLLATGGDDHTVQLWDAGTWQLVKTLAGHTNRVWSIAFSPNGQTLVSSSEDDTLRVWDVATGQCLKTLQGHTNWVRSVAFNADGKTIGSGSDDQTVRMWDAGSGQSLRSFRGYTNPVWSIAFSPDGRTLVSSSEDEAVRLWDVGNAQCLKTLAGHTNRVWAVAFHPQGRMVASGGDDQIIRLWNTDTGRSARLLEGHLTPVWSVAFSPDGRLLASGSEDQTVRLWDVDSGQPLKTLTGHTSWVRSVAFAPGGAMLASGGDDEAIRLWDVDSGACVRTLQGYAGRIWSVAFAPGGGMLASGGDDHALRLWDTATGACRATMREHTGRIWSVAFSPDGRLLASSSSDESVRVWDVASGQCLKVLQRHTNWVRWVAFSPSEPMLASCSQDGTILLWDSRTGEYLKTLRTERLYERMNITGVIGLTEAQKETLRALGAIEDVSS